MARKKFKLNETDFNLIKQLKELGLNKGKIAEVTGWSTATITNVLHSEDWAVYLDGIEQYRLKRIDLRKKSTLVDIDSTGKAEIQGVIAGVDFALPPIEYNQVDKQIDDLNAKLDTVLQIIRDINDSLEKNNRKRGIWS